MNANDAKVLIADDISANLVVIKGLLNPYRIQADLCKSGEEALAAVNSARYDIVFMDHRMPGIGGVEATKLIREMGAEDPQYRSLPVIALTTDVAPGTIALFMKSGFNDFLQKPVNASNLREILEKWLPGEKKKSPEAEETPPVRTGGRSRTAGGGAIDISGVDVEKGISTSGGAPELYLKTIAAFYSDGLERVGLLGKCLETGDLTSYRIHVHGLKTALFNIGAETLSAAARALEEAAGNHDLSYIRLNNTAFISDLNSLLDQIGGCLSERDGGAAVTAGPADMEAFMSGLLKLKEALKVMDMRVMNPLLANLQKAAPGGDYAATLKAIASNIVLAEYDDAEALVDRLLSQAGEW